MRLALFVIGQPSTGKTALANEIALMAKTEGQRLAVFDGNGSAARHGRAVRAFDRVLCVHLTRGEDSPAWAGMVDRHDANHPIDQTALRVMTRLSLIGGVTKRLSAAERRRRERQRSRTRSRMRSAERRDEDPEVERENQESVGSKKYIWRTMLDSRTRASHRKMEGTTHFWNRKPRVGGRKLHPGEDWGCRCYAEAIPPKKKPR